MAITTTKRATTPHRLRYTVESSTGGETATITRATMLTDCMPGPLRAFLESIQSSTTWDEMFSQSPQLGFRLINGSVANNLVRALLNGDTDPALSALEIVFGAAASGLVTIELAYNHSLVR